MIRPGARGLFFGGASLPYDAEVEYLQGTGAEGIILPDPARYTANTIIEIRMGKSVQEYYFGNNAANWEWFCMQHIVWFGNGSYSFNPAVGTLHDYKFDATAGANVLTIDGTICRSAGGTYPDRGNIALFQIGTNGSSPAKVHTMIANCKITVAGTLLYDLKAVRVKENGVDVGKFYNEVDGSFLAPPSGALIIGPDKVSSVGGGYKRQCVRRSYRRSLRPSARFYSPRHWKEAA